MSNYILPTKAELRHAAILYFCRFLHTEGEQRFFVARNTRSDEIIATRISRYENAHIRIDYTPYYNIFNVVPMSIAAQWAAGSITIMDDEIHYQTDPIQLEEIL